MLICTICKIGLNRDELDHHLKRHQITPLPNQRRELERELDIFVCPSRLPTITPSYQPRPAIEGIIKPQLAHVCPHCETFGTRKTIVTHIRRKHADKDPHFKDEGVTKLKEMYVQRLQYGNQHRFFCVRPQPTKPYEGLQPDLASVLLHREQSAALATLALTEGLDGDVTSSVINNAEVNPLIRRARWLDRLAGVEKAGLIDLVDPQTNRKRWPTAWQAVNDYFAVATERIDKVKFIVRQHINTLDPTNG